MPTLARALLIAAALAVPTVAAADTYTRVNEVTTERSGGQLLLTVEGLDNATPRTGRYYISMYSGTDGGTISEAEACYRAAMLALSKPGRYHFKIVSRGDNGYTCGLRRIDQPEAGQ